MTPPALGRCVLHARFGRAGAVGVRGTLGRCVPRTPLELQRRFGTRGGLPGVSGRVSPAGRLPLPAPRTRQRLVAVGGADYAGAPRAGSRSWRRRGPRSIGPGPSRCVIGWRARPEAFAARPETFAACPETFAASGFSDLRAGFVLRDESSRRQRSRALRGSGRAAPEHDPGRPAPGTRPPPLAIPRSTNWARISEEPAAGAGERQRVTRRHLGAYLDELVFRSDPRHNLPVGFGTLLGLGAMREPTTNDTITGPGTSRGSSARCYRSRPTGGSGATSSVRGPQTPNTWYITGGNRTGTTGRCARRGWRAGRWVGACCALGSAVPAPSRPPGNGGPEAPAQSAPPVGEREEGPDGSEGFVPQFLDPKTTQPVW